MAADNESDFTNLIIESKDKQSFLRHFYDCYQGIAVKSI